VDLEVIYKNAIAARCYLTADLKYHQFYEAENQLLWQILDILRANAIQKILLISSEKILNFAIILSENTNPVKYL
jgi:hypothetical protein